MSIFKRNNIQNHTADTYTSEVHGSANSTNEFEQLALYSKNLRGLAGEIMPKAEKQPHLKDCFFALCVKR